MNFQSEKNIVLDFYSLLDQGDEVSAQNAYNSCTTEDYCWRGYYPFHQIHTREEVISRFWQPFKASFSSMQRRQDVFFAGKNEIDGFQSVWVVSMGHIVGLFDNEWVGIQPTRKMAFFRYCEFNRVENGKIAETAFYFDIPHLMQQAGYNPFPKQTAVHVVQPGPMTHGGLLFEQQPAEEGEATLALINKMASELGQWQNELPLEEELRLSWHEDMIWWGPTGIGSTYTIERYAKQHSGPFRAAFSDRSFTGHHARLAEGHFGGFFGWPNFTARLTSKFMGFPPTDQIGEFRVIDIYRRDGSKLAENWIFIDLLYFWKQQGIDFLADATGQEIQKH